ALRIPRSARVQQNACGLESACCEDDNARAHLCVLASELVEIGYSGCEPIGTNHDFADHRVGEQRELAGCQRGRDEHVRTGEVRFSHAAATALSAVVTGGATIQWLCDDRSARGDTGNLELVARLLDEKLVTARCG